MYMKVSLLTLSPGETFRRQFNLTEYINLDAEKQITKSLRATLPSVVPGIRNSSGPHGQQITPPHLVNQQPSHLLGDSLLDDISIESNTIQFNWTFSARPSRRLERRQRRGTKIINDIYKGNNKSIARTAIIDASYLVGAGINAAASFNELPFRYFFPGTVDASNMVASLYKRVIEGQRGNGDLIGVSCTDTYKHCNNTQDMITPSYAIQTLGQAPIIVLCPLGMALSRNPVPCTQAPGVISLGWVMLHTLAHIKSISGADENSDRDVLDRSGNTARDVHLAVTRGQDTTTDANAYAYLGGWAWDLGLGGAPWNQKEVCPQNFWQGRFDLNLFFSGSGTK